MSKLRNDKISVELDLRAQKAQEEIHKLTKEIENIRKQNTEHRKEISRLAATEGDYSAEIKRLNETIRANSKEIDARKKAIEAEREKIDISRMSAADLGKELKRLKKELANTSKATNREAYKKLESEIRRVEKAYAQATKSTRGFLASLLSLDKISTSIKGFFMSLGMVISSYVIGAFKTLFTTIQDFERANSKLASVLGTSIDGVSRLTAQAKFLGRTTTATASQVTGLQTELAKLGFSQDVIEKLTPATLKFAKAVDTDLSSAAAFAGAAMRMFNKDASDAESVMATFAVATTKSALDFSKLQASLSTVGPVANAFGFSVEETTALLGQLSNAGFDASSAATATRNILLNLADANGDLAQALGGPVTNLDELVNGLRKLNTEGVDLAKALELTDKRSVSAFSTFLNGADNILTLRDSITDCTGDFNQMSQVMADNAAGSWAGFESAVEGLVLKFFDFRVALKLVYEWATEVVNWIGSIVDAFSPLGEMVAFVAGVFAQLVSAIGSLIGWFTNLFTQTAIGRAAINGLVSGLIAYKAAALMASTATKSFYKNILSSVKAIGAFVKTMALKTKAVFASAAADVKAMIATRSFNAALMANPIMLVIGLIAMAISAYVSYTSATEDATEATDAWTEASKTANKQYVAQKGKIQELIMVAENEKVSLQRRQKAVAELNKIIPGYNAQIDATTKKMTASKAALDAYLDSLEKEMKYKAYSEKMQELVTAEAEAHMAYDDAEIKVASSKAKGKTSQKELKERKKRLREWAEATLRLRQFKERFQKELEHESILPPVEEDNPITTITTDLNDTSKEAKNLINRLKEINSELKSLRSSEPKSDEDFRRIQERIKALQDEKQQILENNEVRANSNVRQDEAVLQTTSSIDETHQRNMFDLNKRRQNISDADYTMEKARETIRYCEELQAALDKLRANTDSTHTATLNAIAKREAEISTEIAAANQAIDKTSVQQRAQLHKDLMRSYEAASETEIKAIEEKASKRIISEEAAEMYILNRTRLLHQDQLEELRSYLSEVSNAEDMSYDDKQAEIERVTALIKTTQNKILTDTGKFQEKIRLLITDNTSLKGLKNTHDLQLQCIESTYSVAIKVVGEGTEEAIALEAEKQRRIAALNYQYQEQMWQIQEQIGLSWADEYDRELASLKNMHDQGLLDEANYQKARLKIGADSAKKYFDFYAGLSGSMFSAIQDAEIAMSEAKYDVLIQQAKNNGDDTSALEEEKENKKLEIQKKYADVNFAIKVSQIIADTAVSIMKAYADLGPIAGSIAAALLTATGAAQLVQAKAERDKIKNMQPGNTAGSSKKEPASAQRVLSGYSDGGYTGDGDRYEVAGVVHRGEYVVPKPIMNNPRVVDAVGTIEAIRRHKILSMGHHSTIPSAGYADGGYTSAPPVPNTDYIDKMEAAIKEFKIAVKNIRAYVVLQDLERAQESLQRSRAPFTRQ